MKGSIVALSAVLLSGALAVRHRRKGSAATEVEPSQWIAGVPVYGGHGAVTRGDGDDLDVFFEKGATDAMLADFCAASGHGCNTLGNPDEGGLAFVTLRTRSRDFQEGMPFEQAVGVFSRSIDFMEYDEDPEDDVVETFEEEQIADVGSDPVAWGLKRIGVPRSSFKGKGVNIYVMDSGVRVTHRDFGGRAIPTLDANSRPPWECPPTQQTRCAADNRGHGSHVAGSAAGETLGVAPEATIRVMNRGRGFSDAYASMDWLIRKVRFPAVLTMSFGTSSVVSGAEVAVNAVINAGITVTVSAGNAKIDACTKTWSFALSTIGVGSSTSTDARSSFSNFGSCVALFAPGSSIPSASHTSDTGVTTKSGTSMATPHVAGGVALILEENPQFSPAQVRARLLRNAEKDVISDPKGSGNFLLNVE